MKSSIQHPNHPRVVICLDGEPPSRKIFRSIVQKNDFILAADGAANWLIRYKTIPNMVVGDLDGIQKNVLCKIPKERVLRIKDQYSTDLEKVFLWAIQNNFRDTIVVGMGGKRIDHTLSNFHLIWRFVKKINIEVVHDGWSAIPIQNQKMKFGVEVGMTISLIPFSTCRGITLKGFQYNLKNASMKLGEVGVSNVAAKKQVEVEIKRGSVVVVFLS